MSIAALAGSAANANVVDLAFLMDESGSVAAQDYLDAMDALADALDASIPTDDPNERYSITVISFSSSASVVVGPTLVDSSTALSNVTSDIRGDGYSGGNTCYECAFNTLSSTVTSLGDSSIINMMTDGNPNTGTADEAGLAAITGGLRTDGWDSLSFEAVEEFGAPPDSALLSAIAFDTAGFGSQPIFGNANQITDPLNASFVLEVAGFDAYNQVISTKVQRVVDPGPSPIPLPAAAWMLLAGLGGLYGLRRRAA